MSVFQKFSGSPKRAMALVIILGCLVLLSILVIGLLVSVKSNLQSSKAYADSSSARMLTDKVLQIVQMQIRLATTESNAAWASQPGMIRTFNASGGLSKVYKLYSAASMVENSVDPQVEVLALEAWDSNPAIFTDLNEPGGDNTGNPVYPILTPPAGAIDGFSISEAPVAARTGANPIPMPSLWLYVLEDGSLVAPTGSGVTADVEGANSKNPIVGRVAFWADDETSKINVNTAGADGEISGSGATANYRDIADKTFWDVPRFTSQTEVDLALYQPVNNEFQRYPGHPGTVAFKSILSAIKGENLSSPVFYSITPRYAFGGSKGATVAVPSPAGGKAPQVLLRGDRLYASADESLFSMTRAEQAGFVQDDMAAARFFLTAYNRSPELNLFGLPRVSVWPITDMNGGSGLTESQPVPINSNKITPIDQLLAFAATQLTSKGPKPYYFIRQNARSTTADISLQRNLELLNYLDVLTQASLPIPAYGGNFQKTSKYGQIGTRQILTEIFDYIRTTNTQDGALPGASVGSGGATNNPNWFAHQPSSGWGFGLGQVVPSNHPTWGTQGIGSFPRLMEATLLFAGLGENPADNIAGNSSKTIPVPNIQASASGVIGNFTTTLSPIQGRFPTDPGKRAVQAFLLLSWINPSHSCLQGNSRFIIQVGGLNGFKLNGTPMGFPTAGAIVNNHNAAMLVGANMSGDPLGSGQWMGYLSFVSGWSAGGAFRSAINNKYFLGATNPFFSKILPVTFDPIASKPVTTMDFSGGTITVTVYDLAKMSDPSQSEYVQYGGNPGNALPESNVVQRYTLNFPQAPSMPVPGLTLYPIIGGAGGGADKYRSAATDVTGRYTSVADDRWALRHGTVPYRYGWSVIDGVGVAGNSGDVVQSLILGGDWRDVRMLACRDVPASAFVPHPDYGNVPMAHNMAFGGSTPLPGNSGNYGRLLENAPYTNIALANNSPMISIFPGEGLPSVPPGLNGVSTSSGAPGDWDNGLGNYPDGPWINKADEGNIQPYAIHSSAYTPYFTPGVGITGTGEAYFSPNRQIPSPAMFGSLPTGIDPNGINPSPWQTLLFHPGANNHRGRYSPPDHLLLDLFWMPVAEPYAISEPFSSAGKINLNYQIIPYKYITRSTALRAALAGEKVVSNLPRDVADKYKYASATVFNRLPNITRSPINIEETLSQFGAKFEAGEIFKSASAICDIYLVPQGTTLADFSNEWNSSEGNFALAGDNTRERPYANLYAKLTTKSNVFRVHYRVQALQKNKNSIHQNQWTEDQDMVVGERRGSALIERYLDPSDTTLPDAATESKPGQDSFESRYKFRIVDSTNFCP